MSHTKKRFQDLGYAFKLAHSNCKVQVWRYIIAKVLSNIFRFVFDVYFLSYLLKVLTIHLEWQQVFQALLVGIILVMFRIVCDQISEYAEFMMSLVLGPRVKKEL